MQGTWGRRVWGKVVKGPTRTRFRLEVRLQNDCVFFETIIVGNEELERYPNLYGWTLDRMTDKLEERIKERHQEWLR